MNRCLRGEDLSDVRLGLAAGPPAHARHLFLVFDSSAAAMKARRNQPHRLVTFANIRDVLAKKKFSWVGATLVLTHG